MKTILIIAVLVCLASSQAVQECISNPDPKLVLCTQQYQPVCGIRYLGSKQIKETFSNQCFACAGGKSSFTVEGKCEDFPHNANFCSPQESKNEICTKNYDPQCGWFNQSIKCFAYPCAIQGSNRCDACSKKNVLYTTKGLCPKP